MDIVSDGPAGLFFKQTHQIIFAEKDLTGKGVDLQRICKMQVDVMDDFCNFGMTPGGIQIFQMIFGGRAVQLDHEFQEQNLPVKLICVVGVLERVFQPECTLEQAALFQGRNPKHTGLFLPGFFKTQTEIAVGGFIGFQK